MNTPRETNGVRTMMNFDFLKILPADNTFALEAALYLRN